MDQVDAKIPPHLGIFIVVITHLLQIIVVLNGALALAWAVVAAVGLVVDPECCLSRHVHASAAALVVISSRRTRKPTTKTITFRASCG